MPIPDDVPSFATDTNYTNGPDVGTATKIEPSAGELAEGHIRGTAPSAQKQNWWQNLVSKWIELLYGWLFPIDSLSTLKAIDTTSLDDGELRHVRGQGLFVFDDAATDTEKLPYVVDPTTGPGRWFRADIDAIRPRSDSFTATGTWTCPDGVYEIEVEGWGGGGGGGGGADGDNDTNNSSTGGGGGGGACPSKRTLTVVPGTVYDVTVGDGGAAGSATDPGGDGEDSSFDTLAAFPGAMGGGSVAGLPLPTAALCLGGMPVRQVNPPPASIVWATRTDLELHAAGLFPVPGLGAAGINGIGTYSLQAAPGNTSIYGYAGGSGGTTGTTSGGTHRGGGGGGGGGAGPGGDGADGGAGGNGNSAGAPGGPSPGSSAAANSGAGGGGGGGGGQGTTGPFGGDGGGDGGSGKVIVHYRGPQAVIG